MSLEEFPAATPSVRGADEPSRAEPDWASSCPPPRPVRVPAVYPEAQASAERWGRVFLEHPRGA